MSQKKSHIMNWTYKHTRSWTQTTQCLGLHTTDPWVKRKATLWIGHINTQGDGHKPHNVWGCIQLIQESKEKPHYELDICGLSFDSWNRCIQPQTLCGLCPFPYVFTCLINMWLVFQMGILTSDYVRWFRTPCCNTLAWENMLQSAIVEKHWLKSSLRLPNFVCFCVHSSLFCFMWLMDQLYTTPKKCVVCVHILVCLCLINMWLVFPMGLLTSEHLTLSTLDYSITFRREDILSI